MWKSPLRDTLTCLLLVGCGEVAAIQPDARAQDDAPTDVAAPTGPFSVGGTVSGVAGTGLVLQLNGGSDLAISADGSFSFPGELDTGAAYTVTVKTLPKCPVRTCTLTNATGTVGTADVNVTVACAPPRYRLSSLNWGEDSLRISDDIAAIPSGGTAVARVVTGSNFVVDGVEYDGLAYDSQRDLIYAGAQQSTPSPSFGINVFTNGSTTSGNVAPARRILVAGETVMFGLELDVERDRLYAAAGSGNVLVFANASTLNGTVVPTAIIPTPTPGAITLDREHDRLYVAERDQAVHIFDDIRNATSATAPNRSFTWTAGDFPRSIVVDDCRNRLYIFNRNVSTNGHNGYALDNAATLSGAIDIEAAQARMTVPDNQVSAAAIDTQGALYLLKDSATAVRIINAPHLLSGSVTVTADKSVNGAVNKSYGFDVSAY